MKYRTATIKDLHQIIQMKNEVKERVIKENLPIWLGDYPLDSMLEEDIQKGNGRVLEDEGKIIGYACFHHASEEYPADTFLKENLQSFGRIMICNDYLGMHCGTELVSQMIEETKKMPVEGLGILVDACNLKAVHLYKKFGFKREGSRQFPYAYLDIYGLYF